MLEREFVQEMLQNSLEVLVLNPLAEAFLSDIGLSVSELQSASSAFRLNDYAQTVVAMFTNRTDLYAKDMASREKLLLSFTNQVSSVLGLNYPATWSAPVETAINATNFMGLLLQEARVFFAESKREHITDHILSLSVVSSA